MMRPRGKEYEDSKRKTFPRNPLEDWWQISREPFTDDTERAFYVSSKAVNFVHAPEQTDLENIVADVLESLALDEIDVAVFETVFLASCSLRLAQRLTGIPKTTIARRRDRLQQLLYEALSKNETIASRLAN